MKRVLSLEFKDVIYMVNNANPIKLVLTEKELAQYLGVSYWTVRGWRLREQDPLPTLGTGRILYRLQTVEEWMQRSEAMSIQNKKYKASKVV